MIKSRYPLSWTDDLLIKCMELRCFEDLPKIGISFVKIRTEDVLETTLRTWYAHYKFLVILVLVG